MTLIALVSHIESRKIQVITEANDPIEYCKKTLKKILHSIKPGKHLFSIHLFQDYDQLR